MDRGVFFESGFASGILDRDRAVFFVHILYGENDDLTPFETVCEFANQTGATLTVMKNGEHRFYTKEQMRFLDNWIRHFAPESTKSREENYGIK